MQEKDNCEEYEKVEDTDQTNELFPELKIPDFQGYLSSFNFQLDLPSFKLKDFDTSFQHLKIEDSLSTLARQEFKNPSIDNAQKLQQIPNELWLSIFWYFDAKSLVQAMLTCKFFGEIINNKEIRSWLGKTRFNNRHFLFFPEVKPTYSICEIDYKLLDLLRPLKSPYNDSLKEEKELYNPGDKGFVMKK